MLRIRFSRVGKKKQPTYRIVVSEQAQDPWGKHLEILGWHNPRQKITEVHKDRILHWIEKGAKPSPTVHNLLIDQNVISGEKVKATSGKKKKQENAEAGGEQAGSSTSSESQAGASAEGNKDKAGPSAASPQTEAAPKEEKTEGQKETKDNTDKKEAAGDATSSADNDKEDAGLKEEPKKEAK